MGQPSRRTTLVTAATVILAAVGGGCSSPGHYFRSRTLDLWDIVPVSVKGGYGVGASVRATEFFHTGLEVYSATSFGLARGRCGPVWEEEGGAGVIMTGEQFTPRLPQRWPGGPDWTDDSLFRRSSGNFFFFVPCRLMWGLPNPLVPWPAWFDVDANIFLGVGGMRVGVCPGELIDFLAGIVGLDPIGDDVDGKLEREIREKLEKAERIPEPPTK